MAEMDTDVSSITITTLFVPVGCGEGGTAAVCELLGGLHESASLSLLLVANAGHFDLQELEAAIHPDSGLRLLPIADGEPVQSGAVYVLNPDLYYGFRHGRFSLLSVADRDHALSPIDRLFQCLAKAHGKRTVGIVLSGSGSDGTLGLKSINEAGGMTIVQSPVAASFGDMPKAADESGVADHVMNAGDIGRELIEYSQYLYSQKDVEQEQLAGDIKDAIPEIARILHKHTGHNFQHYKTQTLTRRIQRQMSILHLQDVKAYRTALLTDTKHIRALFHELLIGVTAFFRDKQAFSTLQKKAFGNLFDGKGSNDTVRMWVPGCATGQEAYTLAMMVCEYLDDLADKPSVRILGSDINEQALATARAGLYSQMACEGISPERLRRFFRRSGKNYQIRKPLREMCLFSYHNVIADPPFSNLDLISCRNVLIYLGLHLQEKLIPVFHYALKPGGFLFLGSSENLISHKDLFRPINKKYRISRRRNVKKRLRSLPEPNEGFNDDFSGEPNDIRPRPPASVDDTPELAAMAQHIILDEFTPQWAIVNDDFEVLELSQDASRFLRVSAGTFQNNIIRLAQDSLKPGLRSTLRQARAERQKLVHDRLLLRVENGLKRVTLTVQPMPTLGNDEELMMVIFQESGALISPEHHTLHAQNDGQSQSMVAQLEEELSTVKQDLERTVQDLEKVNEELTSSNEELLSINEELHSSNEEIEISHNALRQANDDLENLLTSSQVATLFLDDEHRIQRYTPEACNIFNLIDSDIGRSIKHVTHESEYMPEWPHREELSDSVAEVEVRTRDGRCYLRRVLPYLRSDKQPSGVVVTFTDITHTIAAEQFTRNVLDSLRSFVGVCTTCGILLQANESALETVGVSAAEVLGKPFRGTAWWSGLPDSQRLLDEAIERAAAGENSRFDVEINLSGGEKATVDFQLIPMRSDDGIITHLITSAIDVTHRRQMEIALELAELKTRSVLQEIESIYDSAPIGMCVLDRNLCWTRINEYMAKINGLAAADHIGKSLQDLLPDIAREAIPILRQVLKHGKAIENTTISGMTPAQPGVERQILASWIPVRDLNDEVVGINIVAEEVTEKRRSEERLKALKKQAEDAREQAENASRFKSEFLANMSHEIRTPMTAILGYADLLESHLSDPDNLQSVRTIRRNGRFLINLLNDILDLSKIESGKLELELVEVSPVNIIEQTLDMMRLQADRKQLTLAVDYVGKLPLTLETDPTRLRQILVNLTGNAVKFTEKGSVTLRIDYQGEPVPCLYFHVSDTGIGMTLSQQVEVFDAFRQADSSISRRFGGSGLGLAISQRLAASMGGEISIHSELGKGSTLTLKLPVHGSGKISLVTPSMPEALEPADPLPSPDLPYRLLAVDDRRDVLHVVQHVLEDAGATVSTASSATTALERVHNAQKKDKEFQAIVLDMQMPKVNGYEVASTLRERGFKAPIIALTANAMKGEREKCLASGCTEYLTKPIDKHLLIEVLHRQITAEEKVANADMSVEEGNGSSTDKKLQSEKSKALSIMLVEDHEESARVLVRLLERSHHEVHSANCAAQAMSLLESFTPDVVLTDIGLPDEDGYSLVTRMRKLQGLSNCRFVALTGNTEIELKHQALFDYHITKPVEIQLLRDYLQGIMSRSELREVAP